MARLPLLLALLPLAAWAAGAAKWKQATVYQLLTDRFALSSNDDTCSQGSCPYGNYCGGSYKGVIAKLDYIQQMGFDAVWISPVVENTDCGYHGYWAADLFTLNPNFGPEEDLKALAAELHQRGMLLMVDVVYNHMGPTDESQLRPFNDGSYYHDSCSIDYSSQQNIEQCWLANLPDLKQEDQRVSDQLIDWTNQLITNYSIDGLRIDTVAYVPKQFWQQLSQQALNSTYAVGEVLISNRPLSYLAGYQYSDDDEAQGPVLDAVLNYPLFFSLRDAFMSQNGNGISALASQLNDQQSAFKDYSALGTFVDNHDQTRFLLGQQDLALYRNALTCVELFPGVPIVYYGSEQAMAGGQSDNDKRQPLWSNGGYNTGSEMFGFIKSLVAARKQMLQGENSQDFRVVTADDGNKLMVFTRGVAVGVVTSAGQGSGSTQVTVQASDLPAGLQSDGTQLCDAINGQCFTVGNSQLQVTVANGEPQVLMKRS